MIAGYDSRGGHSWLDLGRGGHGDGNRHSEENFTLKTQDDFLFTRSDRTTFYLRTLRIFRCVIVQNTLYGAGNFSMLNGHCHKRSINWFSASSLQQKWLVLRRYGTQCRLSLAYYLIRHKLVP